jgi:hypothetical protein
VRTTSFVGSPIVLIRIPSQTQVNNSNKQTPTHMVNSAVPLASQKFIPVQCIAGKVLAITNVNYGPTVTTGSKVVCCCLWTKNNKFTGIARFRVIAAMNAERYFHASKLNDKQLIILCEK